jgi:hypothetical protein
MLASYENNPNKTFIHVLHVICINNNASFMKHVVCMSTHIVLPAPSGRITDEHCTSMMFMMDLSSTTPVLFLSACITLPYFKCAL